MQAETPNGAAARPENYLIAGDPNNPATWLFRIRNDAGELDWEMIDRAKAQLAKGFRCGIFEADFVSWAFPRLRQLYDTIEKESIENENQNGRGRPASGVELPCSH